MEVIMRNAARLAWSGLIGIALCFGTPTLSRADDVHAYGRTALISLITDGGYEAQVQRAAEQSAERSCGSARWESGWVAYKAAADGRETEF
jgi:hypothetical protein